MSEEEDSSWKKFPATKSAYENIRDFIINAARRAGVQQKNLLKLELGVEEVIVNIINYAYENEGVIFIKIENDDSHLILEIADYGKPFNPLKKNDPRAVDKSQIENRQEGGFGIALIKKIFVEMSYEYKLFGGQMANCLKLIFKR